MNSNDERSREQRKSFRCPVPESQKNAELRVGRRHYAVRLFNESAGGFAVWLDDEPIVAVGDLVELVTTMGVFRVRVAHITPSDSGASPGQKPAGCRIGLDHLADSSAREAKSQPGASQPKCRHEGAVTSRFKSMALGTLYTLLIATALIGGLSALVRWNPAIGQRFYSGQAAIAPPTIAPAPVAKTEGSLADVSERLGLSPSQEGRIRDLVRQDARAVKQLDTLWQHDPPEQRARKRAMLLEAAYREILAQLQEPQQGTIANP